jgi:biotin transport system substrate-specific component
MQMTVAHITLADRFVPRTMVNNIALIFGGALVTALAAQIQIPMWPVPLTLQTFAVLLVGATLGAGRGAASLSVYLAMGAAGIPVFASARTLTGALPTAGYIVGFVAAAALVGFLASKGFSRTPVKVALSFAAGSAVIYGFGVAGLMMILGLSFEQAVAAGVIPFLIGDAVKAIAAAAMLPLAWKVLSK